MAAPLRCEAQGTIFYEARDLNDVTAGQDLWQYTFTLNSLNLRRSQGFTIYFDFPLYRDLRNPASINGGSWNVLTVQPDLILRQTGFLDGQALRDAPSEAGRFTVDFVWLGTGTPGSLPFDAYDVNFAPLQVGFTTLVPEPATWALGGLGLLLFVCRHRGRKS